jgi:hypothetical protein
MRITFRTVNIGGLFVCNGNLYLKKSTRTAVMMSSDRTFYIGQMEECLV